MNHFKINKSIYYELALLICLAISHTFSWGIVSVAITGVILILLLFQDIERTTIMTFVALPYFHLFNANIQSTSLFYIFIFVFFIKFFTSKKTKVNKIKIIVLATIILLRIPSGSFDVLFKWSLLFGFFVCIYDEDFFINNINKIIKFLTISFLLSSICGYYMENHGVKLYGNQMVYNKNGGTHRFAGLIGDAVFFSQFCVILIAFNYLSMYYNKIKVWNIVIIVLLHYFMILSYSKTGIILSIFSFAIYILSILVKNANSKKNAYKSIIIFIFTLFIILFSINYIINNTHNEVINNYVTRFTNKDLSTGRVDINAHYINMIKKDWKCIFCAMSYEKYTTPFLPNSSMNVYINKSHNVFIETLCTFGVIPAFIIFFWLIKNCCKSIINKRKIINLLPFITLMLSGIGLHGNFEYQYYFLVALCTCVFTKKDIKVIFENSQKE